MLAASWQCWRCRASQWQQQQQVSGNSTPAGGLPDSHLFLPLE
jgi:hypothetical protein